MVVEGSSDGGSSDVRVVRGFAERALLELSADFTPELFEWRGLDDATSFLQWSRVLRIMQDRRIGRRYGHFEGEIGVGPGEIYARQARNALTLCHECGLPLAVVMVCDADAQPQRLRGLKQAREEHERLYESAYPIVAGMADPCREAWVLCGFEPQGQERQRLLDKTRELKFNPTKVPHKLTTANLPHNAKRVLEALIGADPDREEPSWTEANYEHLRLSGAECRLKDYLEEVQERLGPLLGFTV